METKTKDFSWIGSEQHFVDQPDVQQIGYITVGRFGGNSKAGQSKNEDACLVWAGEKDEWEFVMVLDAHNTAESAELVIKEFVKRKEALKEELAKPLAGNYFRNLENQILSILQNQEFRAACREIQGETACMITVRKGKFIWWLSVGDCVLYLFHRELEAMGQFQLNQRHFYEWIGQVNTFDRLVPCYSSGAKELREGENHLFVTTDGLIECPGEPYTVPENLAAAFTGKSQHEGIQYLLETIQKNGVRDSTTVISWKIAVPEAATYASNQ